MRLLLREWARRPCHARFPSPTHWLRLGVLALPSITARPFKNTECEKVIAVATSAARDVQQQREINWSSGTNLRVYSHRYQRPERPPEPMFNGALSDRAESADGLAVVDVGRRLNWRSSFSSRAQASMLPVLIWAVCA